MSWIINLRGALDGAGLSPIGPEPGQATLPSWLGPAVRCLGGVASLSSRPFLVLGWQRWA